MARPRKNIDPEQVRKLAGWGLTQNDIASFVGWSQSLISLRFSSFYAFRRQAIKNGVEQGHGTQSNRSRIKDLWPSASQFWHLIKPGSKTVNNTDPDSFRPQNQRSRTQNPKQTRRQPLWIGVREAGPPIRVQEARRRYPRALNMGNGLQRDG